MESQKTITLAEIQAHSRMSLTIGRLRQILAAASAADGLPDDTPVVYQRIEDSYFTEQGGWPVVFLPWESRPYNPETDAAHFAELMASSPPGSYKLIERNGQQYISERNQFLETHGAYVATDDEGRRALCLHAHY
jgi:hypothetical protein